MSARLLLQSMIDMLRRHLPHAIEMDLSGVTSLDPAGIAALLGCQADARQLECRLTLSDPKPAVYRLLQIAGLLEQFGLTRPRSSGPVQAPAGAALGLINSGVGT